VPPKRDVLIPCDRQTITPVMRGDVVLLYAFDVASEIATQNVQELLARTPTRSGITVDHTTPKAVPFYQPLEIDPVLSTTCRGNPAGGVVRVYDVGVVTVTFRIPVTCAGLADLRPYHSPVADDGRPFTGLAAGICADVCRDLNSVMTRPGPPTEPEAYTVFAITDLGGPTDAAGWLAEHRRDVAALLTDTAAERLSESQVDEVVRLRRTYERGDVVVVDWDAAFVVDLDRPPDDVLYVLELANLQLVEFRVLDQFLDRYLDEAYADLDRRPAPKWGRVPAVLRRLRRIRVDLTKLADEATHITKFVGDWYLARVYLAAHERFALDRWRASVDSRLTQLDQIYTLVQSEAYEQKMFLLEIAIVVLFVIDVLAIFFWKT
jgi:hypothetical protein